jgi:hypothetical protein
MTRRTTIALAIATALGCNSTFEWVDASYCRVDGVQGRCETGGWCSFPADSCPSGRRYAEFAPDELAGTCVEDRCPPTPDCTRWVAMDGSDDNDGSQSAPLASIQIALDAATPGDVICVGDGEYAGRVALTKSGTVDAPIVLRSSPGERARLLDGVLVSAGWGASVGWLAIVDLDITQLSGSVEDPGQCIYFHGAHDVVLRHNLVHDCYGSATNGSVRDLEFDGNRFERCGLAFVGDRDVSTLALTGNDVFVHDNLFVGNNGNGIVVAAYPWDDTDPNHPESPAYAGGSGWVITNNVFAFSQNRGGIAFWQPEAVNALVQNNVFFQNAELGALPQGPNGIDFYYSGAGHRIRNNLYFGSAMPVQDTMAGASYVESAALVGNPRFVDLDAGDFRLEPGSPARDAGITESASDHDIECNPRPLGHAIDVGAYETP